MSSENDPKSTLDAVIREAREDLGTTDLGPKWEAVDEKLFMRIANEKKAVRNLEAHDGSQLAWRGIGALAAAAALVLVLGHRGEQSRPNHDGAEARQNGVAGALASRDGRGDIQVNGEAAEAGRPLAVGGHIETGDARGVFVTERAAAAIPAVTWALETQTRVDVLRAPSNKLGDGSPLILGLLGGAIEAQVAPVSQGEAFAVDVDGVRIAVHGTHLRVARTLGSTKVTVDLSEGVVSIGVPPRTGSTYGTLVTAPAHVEFDAADLTSSMHVDHAIASLRAPVVLRPVAPQEPAHAALEPQLGGHEVDKPSAPGHADPAISPGHPDVAPPPRIDGEKAVLAGVKACAASTLTAASVKVTVSSKLTLKIGADGSVQSARFDPPLAPEARDCASRVIYGSKFEHAGEVEIAIEIEP
ncbi:MAG: FecR domain-containing protein [Polyangiaceae bacterium]